MLGENSTSISGSTESTIPVTNTEPPTSNPAVVLSTEQVRQHTHRTDEFTYDPNNPEQRKKFKQNYIGLLTEVGRALSDNAPQDTIQIDETTSLSRFLGISIFEDINSLNIYQAQIAEIAVVDLGDNVNARIENIPSDDNQLIARLLLNREHIAKLREEVKKHHFTGLADLEFYIAHEFDHLREKLEFPKRMETFSEKNRKLTTAEFLGNDTQEAYNDYKADWAEFSSDLFGLKRLDSRIARLAAEVKAKPQDQRKANMLHDYKARREAHATEIQINYWAKQSNEAKKKE